MRMRSVLVAAVVTIGCAGTSKPLSQSAAAARAEQVVYCADTRLGQSGPICIIKLSEEQQRHRHLTMRVVYLADRIVHRARVNGRGVAVPDGDNCVEYQYRYEATRLVESVGRTVEGTICQRTLYSEDGKKMSLVDEWARPSFSSEREHTNYVVERDERGLERVARFFGPDAKPARGPSGAYELRVERDARGLEAKVCHFDQQGKPMATRFGPHCWHSRYDDFGNAVETRVFDQNGKPTVSYASGVHRTVTGADAWGNEAFEAWFDLENKPMRFRNVGCAKIRQHYDEQGFRIGADCEDGSGKPARFRAGHSYWRATPDSYGRAVEERYFDEQGRLALRDPGYARIEMIRDRLGRLREQRYFLADGRLGQLDGPAIERFKYATDGSKVSEATFDAQNRPFEKHGCLATSLSYDKFRQLVEQKCLGPREQLVKSWSGAAITRYAYDEQGLLTSRAHFDEHGRAVDTLDGFSRVQFGYDRVARETSRTHFRADGSELVLPHLRAIFVRPGYAERFWIPDSRDEALSRIERARQELQAGVPFETVATRYGDERVSLKNPADVGYTNTQRAYTSLRLALDALQIGQYSEIIEFPYAFAIYQLIE